MLCPPSSNTFEIVHRRHNASCSRYPSWRNRSVSRKQGWKRDTQCRVFDSKHPLCQNRPSSYISWPDGHDRTIVSLGSSTSLFASGFCLVSDGGRYSFHLKALNISFAGAERSVDFAPCSLRGYIDDVSWTRRRARTDPGGSSTDPPPARPPRTIPRISGRHDRRPNVRLTCRISRRYRWVYRPCSRSTCHPRISIAIFFPSSVSRLVSTPRPCIPNWRWSPWRKFQETGSHVRVGRLEGSWWLKYRDQTRSRGTTCSRGTGEGSIVGEQPRRPSTPGAAPTPPASGTGSQRFAFFPWTQIFITSLSDLPAAWQIEFYLYFFLFSDSRNPAKFHVSHLFLGSSDYLFLSSPLQSTVRLTNLFPTIKLFVCYKYCVLYKFEIL